MVYALIVNLSTNQGVNMNRYEDIKAVSEHTDTKKTCDLSDIAHQPKECQCKARRDIEDKLEAIKFQKDNEL